MREGPVAATLRRPANDVAHSELELSEFDVWI